MIIKNGIVFTDECKFNKQDVYIKGEQFSDNYDTQYIIDATDCYVIPGLTDIHFHGCVGYDFCDGAKEAIEKMAKYEAENGITTICPATMTLSENVLMKISKTASSYKSEVGAILCGINMEGPFISIEKKGAQNALYIHNPDIEMFKRLQKEANGLYKLVAIAPEQPNAMMFIEQLKSEVVLSIAHTTANYDIAKKAIEKGANHVTHMYNAMLPFKHREPGVIGAVYDSSDCEVELICDGIHIHPAVIRSTFKILGDDRIILISDSMMATGMKDGKYSLGGQLVNVKGNLATLEDGTIAGSATNLMDCMRFIVKEVKIPLESAIKCATVNPAKSIGIYNKYGSITKGKIANVVILDKNLNIKKVIIKGKEFF